MTLGHISAVLGYVMPSALVSQIFHRIGQNFSYQVGRVGLRLYEQAKTKIWARMALDLFFPRIITVKRAPSSKIASAMRSPATTAPLLQRTPPLQMPQAPPTIASSALEQALSFEPFAALQRPKAPTLDQDHANELAQSSELDELSSDVPAPLIVDAQTFGSPKTPAPVGSAGIDDPTAAALEKAGASAQSSAGRSVQEPQAAHTPLADAQKIALKIAQARENSIFVEMREVEAMAFALGIRIDVYIPFENKASVPGTKLTLASASNRDAEDRIVLYLQTQHYVPMHSPPPRGTEYPAYDAQQLKIGEAKADGNCFYHSVAQLLPGSISVAQLREWACNEAERRNILPEA
jgi:hypothetical protein